MFIYSPRKKLFILGSPGVGKTTLLECLFEFLKTHLSEFNFLGFITKEIRENGERKGFKIKILNSDKEYLLAVRKDLMTSKEGKGKPSVGKYKVMIENVEKAINVLEKKLSDEKKNFFIVDEIGKMEVLSLNFCSFIENILNSQDYLIATVGKGENPFLEKVKNFEPALFCEVTKENRDFLKTRLKLEFFRKGKLIVVEGIDGAGKTTFSKALFEMVKERGIDCIFSHEPTSGPFGKKIEELLNEKRVDSHEISSLFLKDRIWHVENLIIPYLEKGNWVILDRYYISTLAYQASQGLPIRKLLIENETIAPLPDLLIYLDIPLKTAFERIHNRKEKFSVFEKREFLEEVIRNYKKCLGLFNSLVIYAELPLEENLKYVLDFLNRFFR